MDAAEKLVYRTNFIRRKLLELIHEMNSYQGIDRSLVDDLYDIIERLSTIEDRLYESIS